jgi:hypothetical protein
VMQYADRGNLAEDPVMVHEFDIAEPGDLLGKSGYFVFIPIPGRGLAMYHSIGSFKQHSFAANGTVFSARSAHLIPWQTHQAGSHFRLFESSLFRIGLNPFHSNVLGFQDVTFATSGHFMDSVFDPDYRPSLAPNDISAGVLASFSENFATVTPTLKNSAGTADWAAGTDRQGRINFELATSDDRYTPFIYGWGVEWLPVRQERDTTEIIVENGPEDVLQRIELTDNSEGHAEGHAVVKVETAELIAVVERGQTTVVVEYSVDGSEWTVAFGGFAKVEKPLSMEYNPAWGFFWQAEFVLCDMHERFRTQRNAVGTAFNDRTIAESINLVLTVSGFEQIEEEEFPASIFYRRLPPIPEGAGSQFPLHPNGGDRYDKILQVLFLLASHQYEQYRMYYDWENTKWVVAERPRDFDNYWLLTYEESHEDQDALILYYEDVKLLPVPPEGNTLVVTGLTDPNPEKATRLQSAPIRNEAGLSDPESVDFSGWVDNIEVLVVGLTDQAEVDRMARTIGPRVLHRNLKAIVSLPAGHYNIEQLIPNTCVLLRLPPQNGELDDREYTMWIKERTMVIDRDDHGAAEGVDNARTVLHLEETWENSFKGEGR